MWIDVAARVERADEVALALLGIGVSAGVDRQLRRLRCRRSPGSQSRGLGRNTYRRLRAALALNEDPGFARGYFIALMFDCAMADPDARDEVMLAVAKTARSMGAEQVLVAAMKRDLRWTKAATDKLIAKAAAN